MEKPTRIEMLFPRVKEAFASELEDRYTSTGEWHKNINPEHIEMIRRGEKIPADSYLVVDILIKVGQDFRLTPDETDLLKEEIFQM